MDDQGQIVEGGHRGPIASERNIIGLVIDVEVPQSAKGPEMSSKKSPAAVSERSKK
jgi:hypothetical protein